MLHRAVRFVYTYAEYVLLRLVGTGLGTRNLLCRGECGTSPLEIFTLLAAWVSGNSDDIFSENTQTTNFNVSSAKLNVTSNMLLVTTVSLDTSGKNGLKWAIFQECALRQQPFCIFLWTSELCHIHSDRGRWMQSHFPCKLAICYV